MDVPVRVADPVLLQAVCDRVDDAFHDETGVVMVYRLSNSCKHIVIRIDDGDSVHHAHPNCFP